MEGKSRFLLENRLKAQKLEAFKRTQQTNLVARKS